MITSVLAATAALVCPRVIAFARADDSPMTSGLAAIIVGHCTDAVAPLTEAARHGAVTAE